MYLPPGRAAHVIVFGRFHSQLCHLPVGMVLRRLRHRGSLANERSNSNEQDVYTIRRWLARGHDDSRLRGLSW